MSPQRAASRTGSAGFFGIRTRLFLVLALFAALLTTSLSVWIEREARARLEDELTAKLYAVGGAAAALVKPDIVPALLAFTPAQRELRTYQDARRSLVLLQDLTDVRRIFLTDLNGQSFVDTDPEIAIGSPLPKVRFHRAVFARVAGGEAAAIALFTDDDGQIKKTGYVPVTLQGRVVGAIGVEADAQFLASARALRARILGVGGAGLALALLLAALFARGLTRSLERLADWARLLGAGDLSHPVPVSGRDEVALLGQTLEQMRTHLEAQDRELRAMVAGVAHEIRNPLAGIRLYADLLRADPALSESQRGRLEKVLGEIDQLGKIVEEFLLYARPAHPTPAVLVLDEVLSELAVWVEPQAAQRGIRFVHAAGHPETRIRFDPSHLRQVLLNLVGNALDAARSGGEVRVTGTADGETVLLDVEDDGAGIAPDLRERIFEPFYTTKQSGAGLGLPIVQRLSILNQTRLEVGPSDLGGARFRLVVPRG